MSALITIDAARELATPGRLDALITDIRHDLAEAVTLADFSRAAHRARLLQETVRRAQATAEIRHQAAELALDCERAVGLAMRDAPKNTGGRGKIQPGMKGFCGVLEAPQVDNAPTLAGQGITKARAKVCRELGRVPERDYQAIRARCRELLPFQPAMALRELAPKRVIAVHRRRHTGRTGEFHPVIKPGDNWNFWPIHYPKLADGTADDAWGYIPGDLYCNCLHYFTEPGNLVVAPMAGSGMILHVVERGREWMRPEPWPFDVRAFDLTPRGPYAPLITRHDLVAGFPPVERAPDYVVMDIPYFGISRGQYGDDPANLARLDWPDYLAAMARVAGHCAGAQERGGLLTFVSPNYSDVAAGEYIPAAHRLTRAFEDAGYILHAMAYSTRRIQQIQGHHMAVKNNRARRYRIMLTDISEIVTLKRV